MSVNNPYSRSFRLRKAYWTAIVVILSYTRLAFWKKILGQKWYNKRIVALHVHNAERVRDAILELKGLFIKLGQMLSILTNFLPEAFQKPLEALQDQIPPRPIESVRERILRDLGKSIEDLFAHFDENALAAASIGQAHRARLHDGTEVVVKVQHADIEQVTKTDLEIILRLTKLSAWFYDIKGMDYLYTQIRKMIEEELDYLREADSMEQIRANIAEEVGITIPSVHRAFSTSKVLTTTWHEGVKISNLHQIDAWHIDRRHLAEVILKAYCRMLFKDGLYHADPHPGNILVQKDGTVVLLDFGAVAPLSKSLREGIPQLIEAAVRNDTNAMIAALHTMGFIANNKEAEKMAEKMVNAFRNFLQNEVKLDGLNFKDIEVDPFNNSLFSLIQEIGLSGVAGTVQVPKDYVLLNRMLTLLLGLCHSLDPKLNPLDVVRPYAQQFLMGEKEGMMTFVKGIMRRSVATTLGLPDELHQVLLKAKKGELDINNPDVKEGARLIYVVVQQLIFTLLLITTAVLGYFFYEKGDVYFAKAACWVVGFLVVLLIRSMRRGGKS
ncbi:MAG: AarF/ABC1/UbiB kinase family protein [Saprospiraceae bacterium]|nr:AarF/ABC1/UbiB kinase family protein [Saprospiraceae bacterium]